MSGSFLTIDGMQIEINNEKNLLELIRKAGIDMPTFCYHPELSVYGACRMCVIENEKGQLEASCSTPPREGMIIKTNTARLRKYRKMILELLLSNHCGNCTTCESNGNCKLQKFAERYHIENVRFPNRSTEPQRDESSKCIVKDQSKCILCGNCVRVCNEIQGIGAVDFVKRGSKMTISTSFGVPLSESPCVGCGQCSAVCPTGALTVRNDTNMVWDALSAEDTKVSVQIAPAVRTAVGKELKLSDGQNVMGKIVAALRILGFDEVFDTSTSADLTVIEEANEFAARKAIGENLPLFTSCCPAWVNYVEKRHPEFIKNVSTCRSPMQMFASILKEEAKQKGEKLFHVAIMPCTAKKFEADRDEFKVAGDPNVDAVITTKELIRMIKEAGIVLDELEPDAVDIPFDTASGAGVIFGVTGGVTEAVIRHIADKSETAHVCGTDGINEFDIPFGESSLHIGIASGLANAEKLIRRVQAGEKFDLIEVMACPGGCVCGAGQPFADLTEKLTRSNGLCNADKAAGIRRSEDNPVIDALYAGILKGRTHELLHVQYHVSEK